MNEYSPTAKADQLISPRSESVNGTLTYITPQKGKPVFHSSAMTGGAPKTFFATEEHTVTISDMRYIAAKLSVDREGFELINHPTAAGDLFDDDVIENVYVPETEAFLKDWFEADRAVVFDVTRRSDSGTGAANPDGLRGPATRVHVDYTVKSGPQRLADTVGHEEAARLFAAGARIIQINVWRPISGPVRRAPLALADASSIRPKELVATDQVFPDRVGEIYHLAFADSQQWYYAPDMTRDEVLLIKSWDSLYDGRAQFTPHGAFKLPHQDPAAPPRESIELRTYVIIENP